MNNWSIRKIITAAAVLTLTLRAVTPAQPSFSGGNGTASSPYLIAAPADLAALASLVNDPATNAEFADRHYRLASDIDLSGYANWVAIGIGLIRAAGRDDRLTFRGVFDGNGKRIVNLKIADAGRAEDSFQGQGLFGVVEGGTVKNLGLDGVSIGVKAGRIGGIAGAAVAGSVIKDCYVIGNISGAGSVGGIAGHIDDNSAITTCYVIGDVSGTDRVGGVAGYVYSSAITGSYAIGKVSESGSAVGTVVGHNWNSAVTESGVFDPEADAGNMLAVIPEYLVDRVATDKKNAPPIVVVVKESAGKIAAGPNPVNRQSGMINFFRHGKQIKKGALSIYNTHGKVVRKTTLSDKPTSADGWRQVGSWDLKGRKGQTVSEGVYAVKGTVFTVDGKKEKVSIVLGVR